MKKLFNAAFFYLVLGLLSGIFAREFTRAKDIEGSTMLNVIHTYVLVLGFVFFLIALALSKVFKLKKCIHKTKKRYSFCRNIQKGWRFCMNLSIQDEFHLFAEEGSPYMPIKLKFCSTPRTKF
ncbi:DUF2871 family protein [Bacillus cereus]|uniref:DUF2871 family protein n=1 Tax=Bacillus cereus TaxID=1396 RepID=UPI0029D41852|nr:DUF2871 family protein [Bacillus cereus]